MGCTVLVPTIGRPELLARCLQSVLGGDMAPDEVLVIDQDSTTATRTVIESFGSNVTRLALPRVGLSVAMNVGLQGARHETVLVTHDDCTVGATWVAAAMALAHDGGDGLSIMSGQVLPGGEGHGYVPSCRVGGSRARFAHPFDFGHLYPNNMVVPRSAALSIGGFDRRFRDAAEDLDFAYRWLSAGGTIRYEPNLIVTHHDWRSPTELSRLYRRYWRAQGQFFAKHIWAGSLDLVPVMIRAYRDSIGASMRGVRHRRPAWKDETRGAMASLPWGFMRGSIGLLTRPPGMTSGP